MKNAYFSKTDPILLESFTFKYHNIKKLVPRYLGIMQDEMHSTDLIITQQTEVNFKVNLINQHQQFKLGQVRLDQGSAITNRGLLQAICPNRVRFNHRTDQTNRKIKLSH